MKDEVKKFKILGYGQIGKALHKLLSFYTQNQKVQLIIHDPALGFEDDNDCYDMILVTIPYTDDFVPTIIREQTFCQRIIVFSTVPIGTLKHIPYVCHCPIEGKHPDLYNDLKEWKFIMGIDDGRYYDTYINFLAKYMNKLVSVVVGTKVTEAVKLLSTLNYGVNIEFMRYVQDLLVEIGQEAQGLGAWEEYTINYNNLYRKNYRIQRYNLTPPEGKLGGHCVSENARFLGGIFADIVNYGFSGRDTEEEKK